MLGYVKVNLIGLILLVCAVIIALVLNNILGTIVLIMWGVIIFLLNCLEYLASKDICRRLVSAPKFSVFDDQVKALQRSYMSVENWRKNAEEYEANSSIAKSYELISSQMNNILESAIKYMKTYDYVAFPEPSHLTSLVKQSKVLVSKLHELQDLIMQVDDSTGDVDITYVDDLLVALRDIVMQN